MSRVVATLGRRPQFFVVISGANFDYDHDHDHDPSVDGIAA
jgi:hypothetical protein